MDERPTRSMTEGIVLSVLVLSVGSFTIIGASANAPLISIALHLTPVGVGAIASVAYLGALVTSRIAGHWTDRSGPATVIVVGLLALALGNAVAGLAWHAAIFYVGIAIAGLGYGSVNPATTVLSNPATARRRGLVMSIKQSGVPLGGIIAGAVLPAVALEWGWRWAFAVSMAACLPLAAFIAIRRGYRAQPPDHSAPVHLAARQLRLPLGYLFGLLIAGVQVSVFAFTAVYLVDVRGFSTSSAGLGVSVLLIGGVVGRLFWGWLSDLFPRQRLLVLQGIGILGAALLTCLIVVPDSLVMATLVALGVCSVGWNGVYIAVVAESTELHRVGASTGASLALINLGAISFPLLVGFLIHLTSSWVVGLLTLAGLSLGATVVAVVSSESTASLVGPDGDR